MLIFDMGMWWAVDDVMIWWCEDIMIAWLDDELKIDYTVTDTIKSNDELRTEIHFKVLNDNIDIDGPLYLRWCAQGNEPEFCSVQSFTFNRNKQDEMKITILTGISYDFEIYDKNEEYIWKLEDYIDSRPNQGILI